MNNKEPSEHAEQVCFINRCRDISKIFVHAIENSLQFPYALFAEKAKAREMPLIYIKMAISIIGEVLAIISNNRKAAGQVNGIPDLFIPSLKLYIEMKKTVGGIVSEHQKKVHKILRKNGCLVFVAYGAKHASEIVKEVMEDNKHETFCK